MRMFFSRNPNNHNLFSYKCFNKSVIFRNQFLVPRPSAVLGPYSTADKQASNPKIKSKLKKVGAGQFLFNENYTRKNRKTKTRNFIPVYQRMENFGVMKCEIWYKMF